jgi:drug/metabolite transporter (DMT)-like permease
VTAFIAAIFGTGLLISDQFTSESIQVSVSFYELVALTGTVLAGLTVVLIKKLQSTDSTVAIFFAQCLVGLFIVAIPAGLGKETITPAAMAVLLSIGLLATAGQLLLTDSYKYLSVGRGSIVVMSAPVFNCIAGLLFFKEHLTIPMAAGALIMLIASAATLLHGKK